MCKSLGARGRGTKRTETGLILRMHGEASGVKSNIGLLPSFSLSPDSGRVQRDTGKRAEPGSQAGGKALTPKPEG